MIAIPAEREPSVFLASFDVTRSKRKLLIAVGFAGEEAEKKIGTVDILYASNPRPRN